MEDTSDAKSGDDLEQLEAGVHGQSDDMEEGAREEQPGGLQEGELEEDRVSSRSAGSPRTENAKRVSWCAPQQLAPHALHGVGAEPCTQEVLQPSARHVSRNASRSWLSSVASDSGSSGSDSSARAARVACGDTEFQAAVERMQQQIRDAIPDLVSNMFRDLPPPPHLRSRR